MWPNLMYLHSDQFILANNSNTAIESLLIDFLNIVDFKE